MCSKHHTIYEWNNILSKQENKDNSEASGGKYKENIWDIYTTYVLELLKSIGKNYIPSCVTS